MDPIPNFPAFYQSSSFYKTNYFKPSPFELKNVDRLQALMKTEENAIVYFYKPTCPYCIEFNPVYQQLASNIHRTNRYSTSTPIVVTQINGHMHKDDINAVWEGFLGDPIHKRGYPTILFKRSDGSTWVWDSSIERSESNLCAFMANFFQDSTLHPFTRSLQQDMHAGKEFAFFYSDFKAIIPRFVKTLDPYFTSRSDAMQSLVCYFFMNPALQKKGMAIPVNALDRPDVSIPSIYDVTNHTEYKLRDAHVWALQHMS